MRRLLFLPWLVLILTGGLPTANAITFTNDAVISSSNLDYDGGDVVVSNCTLTVDGAHTFANLFILNGGVINHSAANTGTIPSYQSIVGELHNLSETNSPTLTQSNVLTNTIVITDETGVFIYTNGSDYRVELDTNNPALVHIVRLTNSTITNGQTISVNYENFLGHVTAKLRLTITGDLHVESGGAIDVVGRGYARGYGVGFGESAITSIPYSLSAASGAGHGGVGGDSGSGASGGISFGSAHQPTALGSGGGSSNGSGGNGGGAIQIVVGDELRVDGQITADGAAGTNSHSGGGAGGSVWLTAGLFSGAGTVTANGGSGELYQGGGGGGGRIALVYSSNLFTGDIIARGGEGWMAGGAGTIYKSNVSTLGTVEVIINNRDATGADTTYSISAVHDLVIERGALLTGNISNVRNLFVGSNSWIVAVSNQTLNIGIKGDALIERDGGITAVAKGSSGGQGNGAGGSAYTTYSNGGGGGGGYGGRGGGDGIGNGLGGVTYGSSGSSISRGSGGGNGYGAIGGGTGGGAISFVASGNVILNGRIVADGNPARGTYGGGGSGGGIYLSALNFYGTGSVSANGGEGDFPTGGGGGGGRITISTATNLFFGPVTAYGGNGLARGGAGTIVWLSQRQLPSRLVIDNGGQSGGAVSSDSFSGSTQDVFILGGATFSNTYVSTWTIRNLVIGANSWFLPNTSLTVQSNAIVQATGGIIADGNSSLTSGSGFGGTSGSGGGGGGGHGGLGAAGGSGGTAPGGAAYGSATAPFSQGSSGGGTSTSPQSFAGRGGGAVRLIVNRELVVDGRISANGLPGGGAAGGGGSGGSVYLTVGTLSGAGVISANGGTGEAPLGSGGGGGRIAIYYATNQFVGAITASGGPGGSRGGAGTIFSQPNNYTTGHLRVDNGGIRGAMTGISGLTNVETLTITGGAIVSNTTTSLVISNLLIGSNSWYVPYTTTLTVRKTAVIEPAGGILADGYGSASASGTGAGKTLNSIGGGAGHGGYGGNGGSGVSIAAGGNAYGSMLSPTSLGSGGGASGSTNAGGTGGGALRLNFDGNLTLNGEITADGRVGTGSGGGGSGGSVYLTVGRLLGTGAISADGGPGASPSGGGGGGRIAIYYGTNDFTGLITTHGGAGMNRGGAGTIYTKANSKNAGEILIENAGLIGTNTLLTSAQSVFDLTIGAGAVLSPPSTGLSLNNLLVKSNGLIVVTNSTETLSVSNVVIEEGAVITASGRSISVSGAGGYSIHSLYGNVGNGGGHGGTGGSGVNNTTAGSAVGTLSNPVLGGGPGGGSPAGNGGAGGGPIRISVSGNLTLNGSIVSDGLAGRTNGGGGAGGSINLKIGKLLSGTGLISAVGGAGDSPYGGGGGGGRIAIDCPSNVFLGTIQAQGGTGYNHGGAGTIYLDEVRFPKVIVSNNGVRGGTTPLPAMNPHDLYISHGGLVAPATNSLLNDVMIASNGWITLSNQSFSISANVMTINPGGGIDLQAKGSAASSGIGYTGSLNSGSGGGGHGGRGGMPASGSSTGGSSYGSIPSPVTVGSGGGDLLSPARGGGAVKITADALVVNGSINVNGGNSTTAGGGGGSGGSIWLAVETLAGNGSITANGGAGDLPLGGGGGGGRIAIHYISNQFGGILSAGGGSGANAGGAGTIYFKANHNSFGQILVDNEGLTGADTPLSFTDRPQVTLADGAVVIPSYSMIMKSLALLPGASLVQSSNLTNLDLTIIDDLLIETGAVVRADSRGSGPGEGGTLGLTGAGGGYGGRGGASATGAEGGITYGSEQQPTDRGSRGGYVPSIYQAPVIARGGGAVRLNVGRNFTLNGRISANGDFAVADRAGGGSGGSVWINARTFKGTGRVSANGGAGEPVEGGGGGGGRVAVYAVTNGFAGIITASGAQGASWGEDGTIYYSTNILLPEITSHLPMGIVKRAVGAFDIFFSGQLNPTSVVSAKYIITTPNGVVSSNAVSVSSPSLNSIHLSFPAQNTVGTYEFQIGPGVENLYGLPLPTLTAQFVMTSPLISGSVKDTNGNGVANVQLQPTGGLPLTHTDTNGNFSLSVSPSWNGTLTPIATGLTFLPDVRHFTNVIVDLTNQVFFVQSDAALTVTTQRQSNTNLNFRWQGLEGVSYQLVYSTNLINWIPYGTPVVGSNNIIDLTLPVTPQPGVFFKFMIGE